MNNKKTNIIFILSDDQGAWAMGCSGNHDIMTPNLDRLAHNGMMMSNFFCASPVCSPARASLLTGQIPSQHGIHDYLRGDTTEQQELEYLEGQIGYTDILSQNNYFCGLSGKWHLGNSQKKQKGFSHWYCHQGGGSSYYNAPMYRDGFLYHEERYVTDAITDDAIQFIQTYAKKENPFYITIGYTAPHSPWLNNHPKEYTELYKDCEFNSCPQQLDNPNSIYLTQEVAKNPKDNLVGYFASITAMDYNIGKILNTVEELGIEEETLIIFTSDNGFSCGQHGFWGKGNGTFPINLFDTSVKVPFIAYHKGTIKPNIKTDAMLSAYDVMPTLLDYVGFEVPKNLNLPGKSFASLLKGNEFKQDNNIIIMDEYGPNRMIRNKEYKYIHRYPYGPNELYNMLNDPEEKNNLISNASYTEVINKLKYALDTWFLKYVNPEIDGCKEAVFGSGQIGLAGTWGKNTPSQSCDDYIKESKNFLSYEKF